MNIKWCAFAKKLLSCDVEVAAKLGRCLKGFLHYFEHSQSLILEDCLLSHIILQENGGTTRDSLVRSIKDG